MHTPLESQDQDTSQSYEGDSGVGAKQRVENLNTGLSSNTSGGHVEEFNAGGLTIELVYKPWGLSYSHFISMSGDDPVPSFLSLRKIWTWGGSGKGEGIQIKKMVKDIKEVIKGDEVKKPEIEKTKEAAPRHRRRGDGRKKR